MDAGARLGRGPLGGVRRRASRPRLRGLLLFTLLLVGCRSPGRPSETGASGRIETLRLESEVFGNTRLLRVWLPPGYDAGGAGGRRYPVLYMTDGQDLFDGETSTYFPGSEWRLDETAGRLVSEGEIEPIVVVGIDHAEGAGRAREYLPYPDAYLDPPEPDPRGRRFAEFLRREVIPAVESRYPVGGSTDWRALGGASYGALVAAYVAATDDALFDRLLLESPSFYVDDGHVFRDLEASGSHTLDRVYLGVGTNEIGVADCGDAEDNRLAVGDVERMRRLLGETARGPTRFDVVIEECAVHHVNAWARRLPEALRFLFGE